MNHRNTTPCWKRIAEAVVAALTMSVAAVLVAQIRVTAVDPGVRGGPAGAGGPIKGLTAVQTKLFTAGQELFIQPASVKGTVPGTRKGLGPSYDGTSCGGCHSQPAIGGTSPAENPAYSMATEDGAENQIPPFLSPNGPVAEAHFIYQRDGHTLDGGVHALFVITGRRDAAGCNIQQPDFAAEMDQGNVSLRIPLGVFGDGLMDAIPDSVIIANMNSNRTLKRELGIKGVPNYDQTSTISRIGWKAADNSILLFAFEANEVELGVTNPLFPTERDETPGCQFNATPEDHVSYNQGREENGAYHRHGHDNGRPSDERASTTSSELIADFIRFLAPPTPGACPGGNDRGCWNGARQFERVGCALCHTPSMETGNSSVRALRHVRANLYSDLLLHHMGPQLADHIVAGRAQGDMFRTTPLWGVGQRIFFLHDGRTSDIVQAIEDHFSLGDSEYPPSEANSSIRRFNALSQRDQQDLVDFLRSL